MITSTIILFIVLTAILYALYPNQSNNWLVSLVISISWTLGAYVVDQYGILAWVVVFPLIILLIKRMLRTTLISAILLILGVSIIVTLIELLV